MVARDLRSFPREFAKVPHEFAMLPRDLAMIGDDVRDHRGRPSLISARLCEGRPQMSEDRARSS
jgi:hypothetical protein